MQPKTPKLLDDVRDAAAFVRQATDGKTLEAYRAGPTERQHVASLWRVKRREANRV
jgi:hypothetical protein